MGKLIWSEKGSGQKQASHALIQQEHEHRRNTMALMRFERNLLLATTGIMVIVLIAVIVGIYG